MKIQRYLSPLILVLTWLVALWFYPQLPNQIATHWSFAGEVNGYMSRFWGTFFMPLLMTGLYILLLVIPLIDPKRKNIEKFRSSYDWFISLFLLFLFSVFGFTLAWNLGHTLDITRIIPSLLAVLWLGISFLLKNTEPNYFIGIRTPWTLHSDAVWKSTHVFGAKLFLFSALLIFLGVFWPRQAFWLIVAAAFISTLGTVVYSYFEFKRLEKK